MTIFGDNIYSGNQAVTSALSSRSAVQLSRTHNFSTTKGNAASTLTGVFPIGTQNLDVRLYITANGSATTSDKITVSAAGTNLITITSFGSASGILKQTVAGLGTITPVASACANVAGAASAELTYSVTLLPASASTSDYQVQLLFSRNDNT